MLSRRSRTCSTPGGLLNPGVIVRPRAADDDLRLAGARPLRAGLGFTYHDDGGNFTGRSGSGSPAAPPRPVLP